jgi:hypothetical protein
MDADVIVSYNSAQEYNITKSFDDSTREIMCLSYIVDQILSDISKEGRKKTTLANIMLCLTQSSETWRELEKYFGKYNERNNLRNKTFKAKYKLAVESGFFGKSVDLEKEYRPRNPSNLDGKLSVSTMLYAIHLEENLSSEDVELTLDVLKEQLNYYQANGFPSWGNRGAPAEAIESVLRY